MLLSREPIRAAAVLSLPRLASSDRSMARVAVEGIISTRGGPLRVYSVHLCYLSAATRRIQMNSLFDRHLNAAAHGGSWMGRHGSDSDDWTVGDEPEVPGSAVVMGDLNFAPDSPEYALVSNGRDPHPHGLVDVWRVAGRQEEESYPGAGRIDYGLISRDLRSAVGAAWIDADAEGSDHQPVWFVLDL
jgi:endonuclease/exonuclease/phosphatase family metal-dependent hydrolase